MATVNANELQARVELLERLLAQHGIAAQPPAVHRFPAAAHTLEFEPDPTAFGAVLDEWARG